MFEGISNIPGTVLHRQLHASLTQGLPKGIGLLLCITWSLRPSLKILEEAPMTSRLFCMSIQLVPCGWHSGLLFAQGVIYPIWITPTTQWSMNAWMAK